MAKNKFSRMYMLEVKGNLSSQKGIEFLIDTLIKTITTVFTSAKAGVTKMDRE